MIEFTSLDWFIFAICSVMVIGGWLVLRFGPVYIRNRRKRYIHPPKRKAGNHRKEVE